MIVRRSHAALFGYAVSGRRLVTGGLPAIGRRRADTRPVTTVAAMLAEEAAAALTTALLEAASRRLRPHCGDPETHHLWLSENHLERAIAVELCIGCPVFNPCGQAAEARRERFGVWAGIDRTVKPGGKQRQHRPRPERNHHDLPAS